MSSRASRPKSTPVVRDFFAEACRTVHRPTRRPCVRPAPFYHAAHLDRVYWPNANVIYVFNFFIPKAFSSA